MGDFVWAITADEGPSLQINNDAPIAAFKAGSLWVVQTHLNTGTACKYTWLADEKPIGGSNNLSAFEADRYARPDVPQGKLTGPIEAPSTIYPGVKANVWFYVPAQWEGVTPLAVQIWGDGQNFTGTTAGGNDLAVARLRSCEDIAGFRAEPGRRKSAGLAHRSVESEIVLSYPSAG